MIAALMASLLAATPDEFGPLMQWEDLAYLAARLHQTNSTEEVARLDLDVCDALFVDCHAATDEFERERALEPPPNSRPYGQRSQR